MESAAEGAAVSGLISVDGWALTSGIACTIPATGVWAAIDSGALVPVLYGQVRSDIAAAFFGFANSDQAGAAMPLDTTTLTNGTHQISWSVVDTCGRESRIGNRFLTVANGNG